MYKTYVGIVRDHSVSMSGLSRKAAQDFNNVVTALKESASEQNINTIVNVVECGRGRTGAVRRDVVNSNVNVLQPIPETSYVTDGNSTPLWDSVGELITLMRQVPDFNDPEVTFVVMVITDGEENSSTHWRSTTLADEIAKLQRTDRWTFTFRVPRGYGRKIQQTLRIQDGNILEWDTTTKGLETATAATQTAIRSMYAARTTGVKSTSTFYADLSKVSTAEVKATLVDVSHEVKQFWVDAAKYSGVQIRDFVNAQGVTYNPGCAFYQLTKTEKEIQDYKMIMVREKSTGKIYSGHAARQLLGLPSFGSVRLVPGASPNFDIFVQSTSNNRKLVGGTTVLYWDRVHA